MSATQPYWISKTLADMSAQEWESLCDGCGQCCLHKLEDESTGDIYFTDVACRYLDMDACRCLDYKNRETLVPECLTLSHDQIGSLNWLPATCAYRLLDEGKPLFDWHPLVSGDRNSVVKAGFSVKGRCVSENSVSEEDMEERIIYWVL